MCTKAASTYAPCDHVFVRILAQAIMSASTEPLLSPIHVVFSCVYIQHLSGLFAPNFHYIETDAIIGYGTSTIWLWLAVGATETIPLDPRNNISRAMASRIAVVGAVAITHDTLKTVTSNHRLESVRQINVS